MSDNPRSLDSPDASGGQGPSPALELRRMIFGHVISQIVATVATLGLADELSRGPRSSDDLARTTGADPDALARLLRASTGLGLFVEVGRGEFALSPVGEWLRSDGPSLRQLAIAMAGPGHWRSLERLSDVIATGRPAPPDVLGMSLWDYYRHNPEERGAFATAMGYISAVVADEVVAHFDVSGFRRIIDVGGSQGILLARLLEASPHATGVLFDLPEIVAEANQHLRRHGVDDRVETVAGDFFSEVPSGGDLYLLKHILHDWDDRRAARILERCHAAGGAGHTLIVVERLLGPSADPVAHVADVLMLAMFGGRERTQAEYESLLEDGGYRLARVVPLSMFALLEAHAHQAGQA
ncbi:MAG TPA: methyltransferase [Acidimicrobiales bacterium]|nr:methyltransferase [Acidimicrobiales bacterium]